LVEHLPCTQGVKSSSLLSSTERRRRREKIRLKIHLKGRVIIKGL
jgi:hypothetical protein